MTQVQASAVRYINISTSTVSSKAITNICLNQHRITSKIDIKLVYRPNLIVISDIKLHFDEIYEERIAYQKIEFKRADIESSPKN